MGRGYWKIEWKEKKQRERESKQLKMYYVIRRGGRAAAWTEEIRQWFVQEPGVKVANQVSLCSSH